MARVTTSSRGISTALLARWMFTASIGLLLVSLIIGSFQWATRDNKGLLDWGSFVASGEAANRGDDPYGVYDLTFRVGPFASPAPNLNPPVSVYPLQLAAKFDPQDSMTAWGFASLAMFAASVLLLRRAYPASGWLTVLWAAAFAGLWHTVELGQIYVPLMVAAAAAWLLLRHEDNWWGGIALGFIAAIKPQFILWPLALLFAGRRKGGAGGIGTTALLSALPLAVNGPHIYSQWFDATPPLLPPITWPGNSSLVALGGRGGMDVAGLALTFVVLGLSALYLLIRRPGFERASAVAVVAALLAGPITWPGYTLMLIPAFFWLGWRRAWPAALLLIVPYALIIENAGVEGSLSWNLWGSVYTLGIAIFGVLALLPERYLPAIPEFGVVRRRAAEAEA